MRLTASIYVDNQAEIGFPVSWLVPRFPESVEKIYIFASDDSNLRTVLAGIDDPRVVSEPIGIWIRKPNDIARAQNECLRRVDRKSYDAHLICQADIWPLPVAYELLESLPERFDPYPRQLVVDHVRLHAQTHHTAFGVTVVFPETPAHQSEFDEQKSDGAYPRHHARWGGAVPHALDIGWHSVGAISRHLRVHARTWSSQASSHLVRLAETDRREFMLAAFDWARRTMGPNLRPMPLDGPYGEVVESMGLREEYDAACSLMHVPYRPHLPEPRQTTRQRSKSQQTKTLETTGETTRQTTRQRSEPRQTKVWETHRQSRTTKRHGVRLKKQIGNRWE